MDFSQYTGPSKEWLALEPTLPPPPPQSSLADLIATTNQGREQVSAQELLPLAPHLTTQTFSIPSHDSSAPAIPARTYRARKIPADKLLPAFIYFHGGGFVFGTLDSEDAACARIALALDVVVINVNYRHTPEHVYPAAWEDAEDAVDYVFAHARELGVDGEKVVVGGVSAGGQLSAGLVLRSLRGEGKGRFAGQVLIIPCLVHPGCYGEMERQLVEGKGSYVQCKDAPVLPRSRLDLFLGLLLPSAGVPDMADRRFNPGNASVEEIRGMPPTTFGVAGNDMLRDEGLLYAKFLTENGIPTKTNVFYGVPHGHRRYGSKLSTSESWDRVICEGIEYGLSKPQADSDFHIKVHGMD